MNRTVLSVFGLEPFRIGGAESFARELSLQLGRLGWRSVLCFLTPPEGAVRRFLESPNVTIEVLPPASKRRWQRIRDLGRLFGRYRPEVVHLHFSRYTRAYPWLAKFYSVKRVFYTDHTSRPEGHVIQLASFWRRQMTRLLFVPLSAEISVSEYNRQCLLGRGLLPPERVKRIYNGVNLDRLAPPRAGAEFRRRYSIPEGCPLVVQVSWIIPGKGIADLLAAAKQAVSQNPTIHFALVGEGAYREQFTRQANEMGLGKHVTWTGLVVDPVQEGVFAAADLLCLASRWEEAFGWVIAEGMAESKPIVATRVGGIPELITDAETGFLVPRGDTAALAERILQLAADKPLRERMGRAGRMAAERKFDQRQHVADLIRLYGIGEPAPAVLSAAVTS